jgi:hypothetical protein
MNKSIILAFSLLSMVDASIPGDVVKPGFKPVQSAKRGSLGLCESDCDKDSDCMGGLICADQHKRELKALGLDIRKANCYGEVSERHKYYEVCFNPNILRSGGAGGGTSISSHCHVSAISLLIIALTYCLLSSLSRPSFPYVRQLHVQFPRTM